MPLACDIGLAGFALGIERVKRLAQALLGGFSGVDGAAFMGHRPKNRRPTTAPRNKERIKKRAKYLGPARCYLREKPAPFHHSRRGDWSTDINAATARADTIDGEPSSHH